jgi:sugar lactone lactonase YvrE
MSGLSDALAPLVDGERSAMPPRSQLEQRVSHNRRRRWLRGAAALVVGSAVVAGIAVSVPGNKNAVRITNPPSTTTTTTTPKTSTAKVVADDALGWTVEVPPGWTLQHSQSVCNPGEMGVVVSLDAHAFSAAEGNAGCFEGGTPARANAYIVSLSKVAPAPPGTPSTPLPISLDDLPPSTSGPQTIEIFVGTDELLLRVVLPATGPASFRSIVNRIVESLRPVASTAVRPLLGMPAIELALPAVSGIAFDTSGNIYLADRTLNRVIVVGPDATVVRVIGNGKAGFSGDGGPAADAQLNTPLGIALDSDGNLYIADSFNNRIRRVSPDGIITTYAGTGDGSQASPDGEPASQTAMTPRDLLWDPPTMSIYVAEGTRVRRIGSDGTVRTVAGTTDGRIGFEAHPGGLATETAICTPSGIAISKDRSLWIAEDCDKHIARVAPDGRIRPVDGNAFRLAGAPDGSVSAYFGRAGFMDRITPTTASPIIALETMIAAPATRCEHYGGQGDDSAAVAWRGNTFYFANPSMGRVCALRPDGTIDTIVGG